MIVILKENPEVSQLEQLTRWLEEQQISLHRSEGVHQTILGLVGDTSRIDIDLLRQMEIVEEVKRVQEPFKSANRKFHPLDTVVKVGDAVIGGGSMALIAGPCSVESEEQIIKVAQSVKASGAQLLRGGAFKPRTSPYAF
ncbi:MAG: 3-deoxy-7-phosphoheptulonate synthase, partial [Lentisphaeria bacterium]|nr:3-deoxy-7-phosphoheptulonate synthase [Lentisphaeria bacterium]